MGRAKIVPYIPSIPKRYGDVLHYMAGYHPALFYPLARRRRGKTSGRFTDRNCDIAIEGYPRVGSTFAFEAFRQAQPAPVTIASHVHVPAQVIRAIELELPCLVLIREPEACLRSLLVKHPFLRPQDVLRGYWLFYRWLCRYAQGFIVADFRDVTSDFGAVIDRVNARFGTPFHRFEHTRNAESAVFNRLAEIDAEAGQGPREAAGPTEAKEEAKRAIDFGPHGQWLERCRRLYATFPAKPAVH